MKALCSAFLFYLVLFPFAGAVLSSPESIGVITQKAEVVIEGKVLGSIQTGQRVKIHGRNEQTGEVLISVPQASGPPLVGMVPSTAVLEVGEGEGGQSKSSAPGQNRGREGTATNDEQASRERPSAPGRGEGRAPRNETISAVELATDFQADRAKALEKVGQEMVVTGSIAALDLRGSPSNRTATVTLTTEIGKPKVLFEFSSTYLLGEEFMKRLPSSHDSSSANRSVNFRSRRNVIEAQVIREYTYTYSYSSGRTYQSKSKQEGPWEPVFAVGDQVKLRGVLEDGRLDVQFGSAELAD